MITYDIEVYELDDEGCQVDCFAVPCSVKSFDEAFAYFIEMIREQQYPKGFEMELRLINIDEDTDEPIIKEIAMGDDGYPEPRPILLSHTFKSVDDGTN